MALLGRRVLGGWLRQAQEGVFRAWRKGSLRQAQEGVCWALSPPSAARSALLALESFGNSALGLLGRGVLGGWLRRALGGVHWALSLPRAARVAMLGLGILGGWLRQAQKGVYWAWRPCSLALAF